MMRKTIFFFSSLLLALTSCTEVIDYNLDKGQERIVIEGSITTEEKEHLIKVSRSGEYFSTGKAGQVSGASVVLTDGVSSVNLLEIPSGSGIYRTPANFKAQVGKTYTLSVTVDGEEYKASAFVYPVAPLDSIAVAQLFEPVFGGGIDSTYTIMMYARETPGLGNYYLWHYYINGKLMSDTLRNVRFADDDIVDGQYFTDFPVYNIPQDKVKPGDTITMSMQSISKLDYKFFVSVMLETEWRGGPFDGPPANVKGNFSNGAIGLFIASDISSQSVVIE
jgi:hypothetical protein